MDSFLVLDGARLVEAKLHRRGRAADHVHPKSAVENCDGSEGRRQAQQKSMTRLWLALNRQRSLSIIVSQFRRGYGERQFESTEELEPVNKVRMKIPNRTCCSIDA